MQTQPGLVTLSKPGIPPDYGFLQNELHLHLSQLFRLVTRRTKIERGSSVDEFPWGIYTLLRLSLRTIRLTNTIKPSAR
ncbi:MAG TPA: hypothetical protein DCE56_25725, partial [Cyanobacteria bacterium UBA8553]|nr:hypothetical protein [Cyanobacteria bacterium UBA8553]